MDIFRVDSEPRPTVSGVPVDDVVAVLREVQESCRSTNTFVKNIISRTENERMLASKGISFLDLKNITLLHYLRDLSLLALRKCEGQKLEGSDVVDRLVEHRTVLEKIRPINHKLKYQIDKLVKTANIGVVDNDDPLSMKPKPENLAFDADEDNMMEQVEEELDESEEMNEENNEKEKKRKQKPKAYVPPKVAAVKYDGDETMMEKKKKLLERAKRRAMSSSIIQELRREYDEGPEEVIEAGVGRRRHNKDASERRKYEEEYFTRLNVAKKKENKNLMTVSSLSEDILQKEDISALELENPDNLRVPKKKKKLEKSKSFKKKSKKFRRK